MLFQVANRLFGGLVLAHEVREDILFMRCLIDIAPHFVGCHDLTGFMMVEGLTTDFKRRVA